ncbi:hypothetical protein B1A99_10510 [Cohnella sp. CIP 111063]|uniref:ABC transporter substrate-binding protein n=1 Tax=unclassified Cohnella TaxID=2636738 RepID=UPI000B8BBDEC|nr:MULTISPECIES: ABC transporter substrate-binding protein [unclassified Cohnella]OXS59952.1 hypothetical protein B1A99_10510 [Cohnella sp. CIP 111063]PRX72762.1 ABC-type nitrate/sulfonate/bicarbonate transport system substrate-binding protein [Cohnella sp. SGD-V74]
MNSFEQSLKPSFKFAASAFLILLLVFIAACGSSSGSNSSPAKESAGSSAPVSPQASASSPEASASPAAAAPDTTPETKELSIGSGRDPQLSPLIVIAQEEGYFAAEGLTVKLELFASGTDVTAALASKSIQFGASGDIPFLIASGAGAPIETVAQQADISGVQTLIVNPDKIKKPEDLNGKKIAYVPGTVTEALFLKVVEQYKLDAQSITSVKSGPAELLPAFQNGNVDAFIIWQPLALKGEGVGGVKLLTAKQSFVPGQEGPQKLIGSYGLLGGHRDFLDANPNTVKAVLRALGQSAEFIRANPDRAAAHVGKAIGLEEELVKQVLPLNVYALDITPELAATLEEISQFLLDNGKIKALPNLQEFIDSSYLQEVDGAAVTWTP